MLLVVLCAFVGTAVETLATVEQVRCLIPYVAHLVDVEAMAEVIFLHHDAACVSWFADRSITDASLVEQILCCLDVSVCYLDYHSRVLCEENLHYVVTVECAEVDVHTSVLVGEGHLEQGSNQSTGADVVACNNKTLLYHLLQSIECIAEILGILHRWHIVADLAFRLCEGAAAKLLLVE